MKKILFAAVSLLFVMSSCNLDFAPNDSLNTDAMKNRPDGPEVMTAGNYSTFKETLPYQGAVYTANTYVRHYMQMTEFRGDNIALCGRTSDAFFEAMTYTDNSTLGNVSYFWWVAYNIIYGANSVIELIDVNPEASSLTNEAKEMSHIKGENYFLRAICHLHLVTMYAQPYSQGRDNMGVVLRKSTNTAVTERATVGDVYDQIVLDLKEASKYMAVGSRRGNAGYASKAAADGLLSRVYLYMGMDDEVIGLVNDMLGGKSPAEMLDTDVDNYFANALNSKETLWAVAHTTRDSKEKSSIASMYFSGGVGWTEIFVSDPMLKLFERYPNDKRYTSYCHMLNPKNDKLVVRYPMYDAANNNANNIISDAKFEGGKYYFDNDGKKVELKERVVGTYTEYYVTIGGVDIPARLEPAMETKGSCQAPAYMMSKFSWQDGNPMLSSPVMLRWAEVILNRAEAYAKKGMVAEALADVNVIRERAGLTGAELMTAANMTERGYTDVLDVVLDERRLELCFEGHRAIDMFRNGKTLNRQYAGAHFYDVIEPGDSRFPYRLPSDEVLSSGIPQNP